jgi:carbon-monoxide dehydrogenase medium subunit
MRGPLRGEEPLRTGVLISGIPELARITVGNDRISIGAGVTHAVLAKALVSVAEFDGLAAAAARAANPAIRSVATVGGNLCAASFAASDLAPQLLCLDATVDVATASGVESMTLERFLAARATLGGGLLTAIHVARGTFRSAHARLPLRRAGDYPVAIVSVSARTEPGGSLADVRIAVGSVEATARRWTRLEAALEGKPLDPAAAAEHAALLTGDFSPREGVEAPAWYRTRVLPSLLRRAFEDLAGQGEPT